jgi:glycine/D-amino acid oxidase-like deaminating enzyme/nitrite reductase/ring-hydroxylating ferredoxin subunit
MSTNDFSNTISGSVTSGKNVSWWLASDTPGEYETLNAPVETEVLVIGGGIAGLTIAYLLCKEGRQVTLVEDGYIGSGESGRTTAHLTHALDDRYYYIEKAFGKEGSRIAAESHTAAIDLIETIVNTENIDCDFKRVDGYLFLHSSDKRENLEKEFEATQRAGLRTEWFDGVPHISLETSPCIRFPGQGQFHIMKYLGGLANTIIKMGGRIYTHTHARHVDEKRAECNGFKVTARYIVVATNTPINNIVTIHTKQFPYRTYVVAGKIPKGSVNPCLWWDTGDQDSTWPTAPYHYVRVAPMDQQYDLLISGGEDHRTGQADKEEIPEEERYEKLSDWTKKRFPQIEEIVYQWSGQVMEPLDYMGFIGKNPGNDNVYIITGDSGNGMTHTTLGGIIIRDLITGKPNSWAELYSPARLPIKETGTFFKEAVDFIRQYADFITAADIKQINELAAEQGAILGRGVKRYAVFRGENGIQAYTAICPHMGCVVQWNNEEKTFDCPCHGSRFTKEGVVINGPSTANLERIPHNKIQ